MANFSANEPGTRIPDKEVEEQTHKNISLHLKGLEAYNKRLIKAIKSAEEAIVLSEGVGMLCYISGVKKSEEYKVLAEILGDE